MKQLFLITIAILAISCGKEETMSYNDIVGTYSFNHSEYGEIEFTFLPDIPQCNLLIDGKDYQFGGYTVIVLSYSDRVSFQYAYSPYYFNFDLYNTGVAMVQITLNHTGFHFEYNGPVTKIK